jgi:hypothetical protein
VSTTTGGNLDYYSFKFSIGDNGVDDKRYAWTETDGTSTDGEQNYSGDGAGYAYKRNLLLHSSSALRFPHFRC